VNLQWSEDPSLQVTFAVWVLRREGIAVPPFDRHRLVAGRPALDVARWRPWVEQLLAAHRVVARYRPGGPWSATGDQPAPGELSRALSALAEPATLWPGTRTEVRHLAGLWQEYEPIGRMWRVRLRPGLVSHLPRSQQQSLSRRISAVSQRGLHVIPVEYESPVGLAIPPDTVVLGVADMSSSSVEESFGELLSAARTLS
jgi:hypothetical protein